MTKIKVFLADDHKIVRMGLKALFESEKDIQVCGETDDGITAISAVEKLQPDVVIMDLMMPECDGADATVKIKKFLPTAKIIILTSYGTSDKLSQALAAGAEGALLKTMDAATLLTAVHTVVNGGKYIAPEIRQQVKTDPPVATLSTRQQEVLTALARGLTTKNIATMLNISEQRVGQLISVLLTKLGAANRTEAVAIALRKHLLKI